MSMKHSQEGTSCEYTYSMILNVVCYDLNHIVIYELQRSRPQIYSRDTQWQTNLMERSKGEKIHAEEREVSCLVVYFLKKYFSTPLVFLWVIFLLPSSAIKLWAGDKQEKGLFWIEDSSQRFYPYNYLAQKSELLIYWVDRYM